MFSENTDEFIELSAVLDKHCVKVGRDSREITRSMHIAWPVDADPKALADRAAEFVAAGGRRRSCSRCVRRTTVIPVRSQLS